MVSALKYPNKSHRKPIIIPYDSVHLAEFLGLYFGDGGINNTWQITISMNARKDKIYADYIEQLIYGLFRLETYRKERVRNHLVMVCSSTNLVEFLITKGAVYGNKVKNNFTTPDWILRNKLFQHYFVRGLIDTDGCIYIHKHFVSGKLYNNIGLCFASSSENLLNSVAYILASNGIEPHITRNKTHLYLYKEESVIKYIRIFGSSNPRILDKFYEWRGDRAV